MISILISTIIHNCLGFGEIPKRFQGYTISEIKELQDEVKTGQAAPERELSDNSELKKLKHEIKRLKNIKSFSPTFGTGYGEIPTLSRFKGYVDGNVVSIGQPVALKIDIGNYSNFPRNSYLSCQGSQLVTKYNFRLITVCDRLITNDGEFEVRVGIKDIKKVDGIEADEAYTGDEETILGEGITSIFAALLDNKKERVITDIGFSEVPNGKNAILNGLLGGLGSVNEKIKSHTDNKTVVMAIHDRKPVIVEFKSRFSYEN